MFCSNCGAQITDGAKFCNNCGAKQDGVMPVVAENSGTKFKLYPRKWTPKSLAPLFSGQFNLLKTLFGGHVFLVFYGMLYL